MSQLRAVNPANEWSIQVFPGAGEYRFQKGKLLRGCLLGLKIRQSAILVHDYSWRRWPQFAAIVLF
jgi:hypothetical protein